MKSFSLLRVAQYARYHYSVTRFHYLSFIVAAIALPTLLGILSKNLQTAAGMLVAIYIFGGIAVAVSTTRTMRGRGTKIMDGVLPVSAAERQVFNLFNCAVVYPVVFAVLSALVLGIVSPFHVSEHPGYYAGDIDFCLAYAQLAEQKLLHWPTYVFVQIVCSTSLLINILARRSLVFAYALVFFALFGGLVIFVSGVEWLFENVSFDLHVELDDFDSWSGFMEYMFKTLYAMIPVALYLLGYVALRKRQVKW